MQGKTRGGKHIRGYTMGWRDKIQISVETPIILMYLPYSSFNFDIISLNTAGIGSNIASKRKKNQLCFHSILLQTE